MLLNTEFDLIWTTPWPAEKDFFLNSQKFAIREIRKISYENPFFSQASYTNNFLALHCHYTGDTQYRVWFDLDNSLTRWRTFLKFSKICNSRNSQNSVSKTFFFSWESYTNNFWLYTVITLVILNTEFSLIWATPWPDAKQLFLKFSKIRNSRNSQNTVLKPIFFLGKLYQQLFGFTLCLHWWYSIPLVWFGQLLDPMKKNFLDSQKFAIREIRKTPNQKPFFSLASYTNNFWLYTVITLVIPNTEFGLIWATPWPDEKPTIFKILKNSQFAKFPKFRMKTQLFPRHALPKAFLLYTPITLVILHTAFGLIWTTH